MKYCQHCGSQLSEGSNFCESCGARIEEVNTQSSAPYTTQVDTTGIEERNIILAIVLSIVTCGIYGIYWQVKINNELLQLSRKEGPGGVAVILLTIITCGIYGIYWSFKMGTCVDEIDGNRDSSMKIVFLLLCILGFGFVNLILAQNSINDYVNKK